MLITGSTGGVGLLADELATRSGALVVGTCRQARYEALVRELGADEIVVGEDLTAAGAYGPSDLVAESLGGTALTSALDLLAPGGTRVSLGRSADRRATTWTSSPACSPLTGCAHPSRPREPGRMSGTSPLLDGRFTGKAVLHLGSGPP